MQEHNPDAGDEKTIGDVEIRPRPISDHHEHPVADGVNPVSRLMEVVSKIPRQAVQPEPVIEISENAGTDESERDG
jgi:hypothetical protein